MFGFAVRRSTYAQPRRLSASLAAGLLALTALLPTAVFADDPPTGSPPPTTDQATTGDPAVDARIEAVIAAALAYRGTPYRVGTEGPDTIDCSGLVFRAFSNAAELNQVGSARLRAAGYMRWFATRSLLTTDPADAERGDLVIYGNGVHIGIYLGDGRVISALVTGVTVHSMAGITIPPTGFLAVDWSGERGPFRPGVLPTTLDEAPAALVPPVAWLPEAPAPEVAAGPEIAGQERVDLRTASSRTFEASDGKLTTEIFARPIHYLPEGSTEWQPIDLTFQAPGEAPEVDDDPVAVASTSPVSVALGDPTADGALLSLGTGAYAVNLDPSGAADNATVPELGDAGHYADYRDLLGRGLGLRVFPRVDGMKAFLVFDKEPDDRAFTFAVDAPGLTLVAELDGSVTLRDAADAIVGRFTRPMLLDSSDIEGDGGGVRPAAASVRLEQTEDGATQLSVIVERAALEEAVYPAYVDLGLVDFPTSADAAMHTFVSSAHPNANFSTYQRPEAPGFSEMWHGRRPDRRDDNEAYLQFPGIAELLSGATVESASLEAFPYWQGGDETGSTTWLAPLTTDWDVRTVTWETRPTASESAATFDTTQGSWTAMDVSAYVQGIVSGAAEDHGFVLHADAAGRGYWKRFVAESPAGTGTLEPRLVVHWSGLRPAAATQTFTYGSNAVLAWSNQGLAPAATRLHVQLSVDGKVVSRTRVKGYEAAANTLTLFTSDLEPGTYSWSVRAKYGDATEWSDWSNPGTFTIAAPDLSELVL